MHHGTCAATAETPQWRHRQRGGIRGPKKPASALVVRMLCLQRKSSPICKENARRRTHLEDARGLIVIRREVHGVARYEAKSRSVAGYARHSSLIRELQSRLPAASPLCTRLISSIERPWHADIGPDPRASPAHRASVLACRDASMARRKTSSYYAMRRWVESLLCIATMITQA